MIAMTMFRVRLAVALLASTVSLPLAAQVAQVTQVAAQRTPVVAVTQHVGRFNGQEVRYSALVSETFLKDSSGAAVAAMVTTAYVRDGVADRATRPVMFLFNGGPGASSSPLHFGAFGPVRRNESTAAQSTTPNPDSPLDVVDLVFIDPIGTGYSKPFPGVDGRQFWSRTGDARSVRTVMEAWLKSNGRERSPLYLCGESYGTVRAALIMRDPGNLRFDGLLLFSVVGERATREVVALTSLPSYAATAWFHQRIDRAGRSVQQVYEQAVEFTRAEYAAAMGRGAALTAEERGQVAGKMSALIGLPRAQIEANNLRIAKDTFMFTLLKDQGLRTGMLDGRPTARLDAPARRPPYNDPGMNYSPEVTPGATLAPVDSYYKDVLKFAASDAYSGLNLEVNSAWNHEGMTDVMPLIGEVMRSNARMRLLWTGGYFDITTPLFAAQQSLDRAGMPADRMTSAFFVAGHSVFEERTNRVALSQRVRAFVTR